MKERPGFGDTSKAENAMVKIKPRANGSAKRPELFDEKGLPNLELLDEMQLDAYVTALLSRMIVEWNVTDEHDKPLPICMESIELLEPEDGDFLAIEAQRRIRRRPAPERTPFVKRSGRRSTATRSPIGKSGAS